MTRRAVWLLVAAAAVALAALIGTRLALKRPPSGAGTTAATPAAAASAASLARAIELAASDVAVARRSELVSLLAVSGGLKAVDSAVVKARVAAVVTELHVREGDSVRAGQLLGRLDDTEYRWRLRQAEDQAAAAQAQLEIAERALENNRALVTQGFISKNALDTSASSASGAQASLQAARAAAEIARKALRDCEIRAPLAGLVSARAVQPGERVPLDARLLEIVDLSRIELEAAVAPEDVLGLRVGQAARVQVDGLPEALSARVARINPATQAGTRAVLAYLAVQPVPGLRQGLFARGSIELARRPALVVPASAVRNEQARPYVLVAAEGRAVQRPVTRGARGEVQADGRAESVVELTAGVAEGETVLLGSVGALRDGTPITLAPAR